MKVRLGKVIKVDFSNPRARSTGTIIAPSTFGEWVAVSAWHPDSEWKGTVAEIRQARAIRTIVADGEHPCADTALRNSVKEEP